MSKFNVITAFCFLLVIGMVLHSLIGIVSPEQFLLMVNLYMLLVTMAILKVFILKIIEIHKIEKEFQECVEEMHSISDPVLNQVNISLENKETKFEQKEDSEIKNRVMTVKLKDKLDSFKEMPQLDIKEFEIGEFDNFKKKMTESEIAKIREEEHRQEILRLENSIKEMYNNKCSKMEIITRLYQLSELTDPGDFLDRNTEIQQFIFAR